MKLQIKLFLLTATMLTSQLRAQTFQWSKAGGNADENFSPFSVTDKQGNTWSVSNYSGEYHLNGFNFNSAGSQDFVFSRFNKYGTCVLALNCGGAGSDAALSIDIDKAGGNLIICGAFSGSTNLFGTNLVSNGSSDGFVASVAPNGTLNWIKQFGGTEYDIYEDVAVDKFGFIYTTGYVESDITFAGSTWFGDGWPAVVASKYSPEGVEIWLRKGDGIDGGDWSVSRKIEVDNDQNVYWGGYYYSQFNLGAFSIFDGNPHGFFAKLNPSGVPLWVKDFGGVDWTFYYEMDIDRSGNIYVGGQFDYEMEFDGHVLTTTDPFATNAFLARINGSDGSTAWINQVLCDDNSIIHDVTVINKNLVVAVGEYQGVASYDDLLLYNDDLPEYDGMLIKANTATGAGTQTFAFNADATVSAQNIGFDKVGDIYITGGFKESLTLDGTLTVTSYGGWDVLFTKISGLLPREMDEETMEMETASAISVYPNPASTSITLTFDNTITQADHIKIIDLLGNEVLVENIEVIDGVNEISIDISGLAPGIYFASTGTESTQFLKVN